MNKQIMGQMIQMSWLDSTFEQLSDDAIEIVIHQYARAFILMMISGFLIIRSTIDRYRKACSDNSSTSTATEINAQYYQQESAKLRQQIQMLQNSNRHLMGDALSTLTVKELKQLENRLERGITRIRSKKHEMLLAEIEYLQKREIELENENLCLRTKIAEVDRFQQANMVSGQELNAIQALASRNFFNPIMIETGTAYPEPDKKVITEE
ncbi:hypothetical protein Lal_00034314 [Lupinus albus]|nr:hypothetical protein Lal_00034314 [Lupinus albus]